MRLCGWRREEGELLGWAGLGWTGAVPLPDWAAADVYICTLVANFMQAGL